MMIWRLNQEFLVTIPTYGGSITEGIVGSPRFINPILALSDADKDMTALIYSGLLKATPDGQLINDLAKSWSVDDDGLIYTFTIKDNAKFHDGAEITTEDIEFTIQKAQDPYIKSPRASAWKGVTAKIIDKKTIEIITKEPYAPFLENLTLGILPKHLWKNIKAEEFPFSKINTNPIGSGPYKVSKVKLNTTGLPTYYELRSFNDHASGKAFISYIKVIFYQNEKDLVTAYKKGDIGNIHGISAKIADELKTAGAQLSQSTLPRTFGVFFNQSEAPVLANKEVRQALDIVVDRDKIIREVLGGYGAPIFSPIPFSITGPQTNEITKNSASSTTEIAKNILEKNGWKANESGIMEKKIGKQNVAISFTIATADSPDLKLTADLLKAMWKEIGAEVDIKVFEYGDFNQNVVRPRKYDALLFGSVIGRDMDLYPFWHSSKRNDPGLNMALYTNITADKLLDEAKKTYDTKERAEKYLLFEQEIKKDVPAVFIYSPNFIYIIDKKIKNVDVSEITAPQERFLNISKWYINTDRVWKIFAQ